MLLRVYQCQYLQNYLCHFGTVYSVTTYRLGRSVSNDDSLYFHITITRHPFMALLSPEITIFPTFPHLIPTRILQYVILNKDE